MKFHSLRPMIWTDKLEESIKFYTELLGFSCDEYNPDWKWASLHKDEAYLMLASPNEHTPFEGCYFSGSFYFQVDDVDTLWAQLKDEVHIYYPIDDFEFGMREFGILDINGYILQFGKEIEVQKSTDAPPELTH
jgi:catechol 2,3-dioxygenase-like lactoylglutathione lyase family enzyme